MLRVAPYLLPHVEARPLTSFGSPKACAAGASCSFTGNTDIDPYIYSDIWSGLAATKQDIARVLAAT